MDPKTWFETIVVAAIQESTYACDGCEDGKLARVAGENYVGDRPPCGACGGTGVYTPGIYDGEVVMFVYSAILAELTLLKAKGNFDALHELIDVAWEYQKGVMAEFTAEYPEEAAQLWARLAGQEPAPAQPPPADRNTGALTAEELNELGIESE